MIWLSFLEHLVLIVEHLGVLVATQFHPLKLTTLPPVHFQGSVEYRKKVIHYEIRIFRFRTM